MLRTKRVIKFSVLSRVLLTIINIDRIGKYHYSNYMQLRTLIIIILLGVFNFICAEEIMAKIKNRYDKITSLQGNFMQTVCSELNGTCNAFSGKFLIARPYYSRLEVISPEKQLLVTDSLYSYIYLQNQKKLYIQSINTGVNFFKIFDLFLSDTARFIIIKEDSNYTTLKDTLKETSMIRDLSLTFNKRTYLIEQFQFSDMNGNEMKFELTNLKVNPKVAHKQFTIEIPKSTEIIKY
ncbi:MAG: outer membrane lipoprotein carrier protein LolA [candidate division WOR-3 bacterium]